MKSVNPYLNFDGQAEVAFNFYQSVFGGELEISRFKDLDDNMGVSGDEIHLVANASLPMTETIKLFGSDVLPSMGQKLEPGNNFYINLETESKDETEKLFRSLSDGGSIIMPLQKTEWAELFGMIKDRFGIKWMIYLPV